MTTPPTYIHKRGDGLDLALMLPANFADGHFAGWTPTAQVRTVTDALVATTTCTWDDPLTTRVVRVQHADTSTWPVATLYMDVQLSKTGEPTHSTETVTIYCLRDITHA